MGNGFAALKADALEICIYEGRIDSCNYPRWLQQTLLDDAYVVDGVDMYNDVTLSIGDVFLINKYGQVRWMDRLTFNDLFYIVV